MGEMSKLQFSPSSLQDLIDCRRRYYYRNRLRLSWPAEQAAPMEEFERHTRIGAQFHLLVQQYFSGVDHPGLARSASQNERLAAWWQRFLRLGLPQDSWRYLPEQLLVWHDPGYKLAAKYDLIEIEAEGGVVIYDWKTTIRPASKSHLAERMQTKVYPLLLARAGHELTGGGPIAPERISMVYWFAEQPDSPVNFPYSAQQLQADEDLISGLVAEVSGLETIDDFPLTNDLRQCRFCEYRSLCDRGAQAGELEDWLYLNDDTALDLEIDLEGIEEIEF